MAPRAQNIPDIHCLLKKGPQRFILSHHHNFKRLPYLSKTSNQLVVKLNYLSQNQID